MSHEQKQTKRFCLLLKNNALLCKKLLHSCWEEFDKLINLSFHLLISTAQIISPMCQAIIACFNISKDKSHKLSQQLKPVTLFSKDIRQFWVLSQFWVLDQKQQRFLYILNKLIFFMFAIFNIQDASPRDFSIWIYGVILWIINSYYCLRVIVMSTLHQPWLWYASLIYQLYVLQSSIDETVTREKEN